MTTNEEQLFLEQLDKKLWTAADKLRSTLCPHVGNIDIETCSECGGAIRIIASSARSQFQF